MKPLRIRGAGYGRFNSFDVYLEDGTTAIVGPNGAGKSRLLNAIELGLFADGGRDLNQWVSPFGDTLELQLEFEHDGTRYRVRRTAGKKTTLHLEEHGQFEDGGYGFAWKPLNRENARATQAALEELLGLTRETFRASSFLAQGDAGAFTEADPADRKRILGAILDPRGTWQRLEKHAKADLDAWAKDHTEKATHAHILDHTVLTLGDTVGALRAAIDREAACRRSHEEAVAGLVAANHELTLLQAAIDQLARLREEEKNARTNLERFDVQLGKTQEAAEMLVDAKAELEELTEAAGPVAELEEKMTAQEQVEAGKTIADQRVYDALERTKGMREAALAYEEQVKELDAKREVLLANATPQSCELCGQRLGHEALTETLKSYTAQRAALAEKADAEMRKWQRERGSLAAALKAQTEYRDFKRVDYDTPLAAARLAAARVPNTAYRVQVLETVVGTAGQIRGQIRDAHEELDGARAALQAATIEAAGADEVRARVGKAQELVGTWGHELEEAVAGLAVARTHASQAEEAARELAGLRAELADAAGRKEILTLAERAYGKDGVPLLIAENAIPTIEARANELLELLPTEDGVTFHLELHTQREVGGDHLRETLDIVVYDADGARPYETFSGGERARLNIALRIALARLLASRASAESRLLAVDELEYLDELGQAGMVDVLRSVAGEFDRILVVSHAPNVQDAFDRVIEIEKTNGVSRVAA